jgi:hypothetical protein
MQAPDFQVQNDRALFRKAELAAPSRRSKRNGGIGEARSRTLQNFQIAPIDKMGLFCDLFNSRRSAMPRPICPAKRARNVRRDDHLGRGRPAALPIVQVFAVPSAFA